jgi:ATP-binding cassette subfamily C protein LapB
MTGDEGVAVRPPRIADWLMAPLRANRSVYLKVAVAAVMINLFALVSSLFSMTVYNRIIPNNATESLIALSVGLGIILIFDFVLKILRAYFIDLAGADVDHAMGEQVFDRLLSIRLDKKRGSTGGLASMMRELETLRDFFASATVTALVDGPFILITLIVIVLIGGWIVIVPLVMIPIVLIAGWVTHPTLDRMAGKGMGEAMLKQSVLVEAIGGLEMIKSVNAAALLRRRWMVAVRAHSRTSLLQRLVSTVTVTIATSGQQIAYAAVVVMGVFLIGSGHLSMGGLIACSILTGRALAPLSQIASLLSRLSATGTAYRQIDALMQTPVEGPAGTPLALAKVEGGIEFRGVSFTYPGAAQKALSGISFQIKPGEKVALLGRVGSGKSTVARMVLGLYPPEEGLVLIDGTEVRQLDPEILRSHVGAVLQDSVLLSGTVRDNIRLDRAEVDDEELLRAATLSGTHDFVGRLANGYDLLLADRGESLSGGQRQSIAVARALAGRPSLLLLDEPTSAMDSQSEQGLIDRLRDEMKDRTMLLVTHRMPLLQLVDRIILLDSGRIVADGPRDAVLGQLQGPVAAQGSKAHG